ncbi:Hypothetical protein SRAE_2000364900 [Strongyloides ratti]|uniref:Uncharacterized protein n=1 Tax=Strongyloides ratti TaxID=34506 RepID=A0A090LGR8_STRRB|nr:Hypothetical protein SRAE_2000364900 [Strongyloides ratti]CEF68996.1 Hypothetical protein SRAE_2000364900 [Strongyloides ratti]
MLRDMFEKYKFKGSAGGENIKEEKRVLIARDNLGTVTVILDEGPFYYLKNFGGKLIIPFEVSSIVGVIELEYWL